MISRSETHMTMHLMSQFRECDVCGMFTNRVHKAVAYQTDTIACDECFEYDAEAYGEPLAEFLTREEYNRDREAEIKCILEEGIQHTSAKQVADAILNIFSDSDIELIAKRISIPRE